MQFASPAAARAYSDRAVDPSWNEWAVQNLMPAGKDVVDIGCGGGIYSFGFAALGARSVIGIDKSPQYVDEARQRVSPSDAIAFRSGDAEDTQLPDASADIVFERAVIHHLSTEQMARNATEARRLLRDHGVFAVQDRTIEDVESDDPQHWIRATLFEVFPRLLDVERSRRPSRQAYSRLLTGAGFRNVRELRYDEVRRRYVSFDELKGEILTRKGKSILFELNDAELELYCRRLEVKTRDHPLIERDVWTLWLARK
jgi:ubiquinone/menaquinone biosynthesis C-methylase UbiE